MHGDTEHSPFAPMTSLSTSSAAPAILYGTAWKETRTASLVERAITLGFRGVDTACQPRHYDEAGVGAGVAACLGRGFARSQLYLQTKFTPLGGQDPKRVPYDPRASVITQVAQSCNRSLENLRTDYLDALLLHSPISPFEKMLEAWEAMEAEVSAGRVRALGISNCYDMKVLGSLWRAVRVAPSVVQNRFYAETGYDREVRAFCSAHGTRYQSFWTLTANRTLLGGPELRALAERHAATPAQVFFRYLTVVGVTPLSGTTSEQHMRDDLSIFGITLSQPELDEVSRLLERAAAPPA
jgi:diketogulonate reductase-like aldo/keto reductase